MLCLLRSLDWSDMTRPSRRVRRQSVVVAGGRRPVVWRARSGAEVGGWGDTPAQTGRFRVPQGTQIPPVQTLECSWHTSPGQHAPAGAPQMPPTVRDEEEDDMIMEGALGLCLGAGGGWVRASAPLVPAEASSSASTAPCSICTNAGLWEGKGDM